MTKTRKRIVAMSVACTALSIATCLSVNSFSSSAEELAAEQISSLAVCEKTLKTIGKDVESIVKGYNSVYKYEEWEASEIEYSTTVYITDSREYGMYLDFDGDNGYAVITTDNKICGLETSGDLEYLRGAEDIYYSYFDGFMYLDERGDLQKYEDSEDVFDGAVIGSSVTKIARDNVAVTYSSATIYPGQEEAGDGEIDPAKIDAYVAARYPGYTLSYKYNSMVKSFDFGLQSSTSYYIKDYIGKEYFGTEGNCNLTATFNVMRNWGKRGYIDIPYYQTSDIQDSILNDPLYSIYGKGKLSDTDDKGTYEWKKNYEEFLSVMPNLYSNIRSYAVKQGYTVGGYAVERVPATMEYVANYLYDNELEVLSTTSVTLVGNKVDRNQACYMSMQGSSTYKNHGVAMVGYYIYCNETSITSSYSVIDYKYFFEIADGHNETSKVFDPNTSANPKISFCYLSRC